jgi:hypothetical protein
LVSMRSLPNWGKLGRNRHSEQLAEFRLRVTVQHSNQPF